MAATSVKGIRRSDDDLERNRLLRIHRGEGGCESELLLVAMRVGLRVLAAQARSSGVGQYAGYDPLELAQRLRVNVLAILDFLESQGQLPPMGQRQVLLIPGGGVPTRVGPAEAAPVRLPAPAVSGEATGAVLAFSGGFLDDDE